MISTFTRKFYFTPSNYRGHNHTIMEKQETLSKDIKSINEWVKQGVTITDGVKRNGNVQRSYSKTHTKMENRSTSTTKQLDFRRTERTLSTSPNVSPTSKFAKKDVPGKSKSTTQPDKPRWIP